MSKILIGNVKGPQGIQGEKGDQGLKGNTGEVGPQGPLPELVNNALAEEAGMAALDAAMGKTLNDQIAQVNRDLVYKYTDGKNCLTLPAGRYLLVNGQGCPEDGYYWFCDVVYDMTGDYRTITMRPFTGSKNNFFYIAKYSNREWLGWEKYLDLRTATPGIASGDIYIGVGYVRIGLEKNNLTLKWDGTITKTENGVVTFNKNITAI